MTAPKNNIDENKPKPSLIPMDILTKYLTPAYEEGIDKYKKESWRGGFPTSIMIDATMRHITEFYYNGHDIDPTSSTGKHHLAGAIFSLISILHSLEHHPELDDRIDPKTGIGKEKTKRPEEDIINDYEKLLRKETLPWVNRVIDTDTNFIGK